MKQILKVVLTTMYMVLAATACRTTSHSNVERRSASVERQREAKTDTVSEHTADSVLVYVDRGDSIVRIVERTVHTRERMKVVRDTVVVYVRNDSIANTETVKEKTPRSPPRWKLTLAILGLLSTALVVVKLLTSLKLLKL